MLRRSRHLLTVPFAVVPFAVVPFAVVAAPAGAATRYAHSSLATKGQGAAPCLDPAKPCTLLTALGQAVSGDDVQLSPGNYYASRFVLAGGTQAYTDPVIVPAGVTMHGSDPANLPVIHVQPDVQGDGGVEVAGTIRDVAINGTAKANNPISYSLALGANSLADRVRVRTKAAENTVQIACSMAGASIRSSVCLGEGDAPGGQVTAVSASSKNATVAIRNVTGISTVNGTSAISNTGFSFGTSDGTAVANVSNSIFRGTGSDVRVRTGLSGGDAKAYFDHSNWVTRNVSAVSGGSAVLFELGGNQTGPTAAEPEFLGPAEGDFRQITGSPTINAGVVDTNNGTLALGGANRTIGITTDIGADEFDPDVILVPLPTPFDEPVTDDPEPTPTPTPAPTPLPTPAPDRTAPGLTGLTLAKTVTRKKGTTIKFTLSEAATVRLAFAQPKSGRVVGGKCRALTKSNRTKQKCTIANVKGTLMVAGRAGANAVSFRGKLSAKKQLALGSYTLTAKATDPAGNQGAAASKRFTLKQR
ncbi:MAG: hypothetical protein J7513_11665 [Solirubrobacteraceae bacterium]|nr:hypothetical protein [Solirubrobacteraceae bacterium]